MRSLRVAGLAFVLESVFLAVKARVLLTLREGFTMCVEKTFVCVFFACSAHVPNGLSVPGRRSRS